MKAAQYAEALYLATSGVSNTEADRVVGNLAQLLHAKGHRALLPLIVREFERLGRRRADDHTVTITIPREGEGTLRRDDIARDIVALGAGALPQAVHTDPTLIGGYRVRAKGREIDRTHKRTLIGMYHALSN